MGYQDRDYYREEDEQPKGFQLSGKRTMVVSIVVLCVLIFIVDAFTGVRKWELVEKIDGREKFEGVFDDANPIVKKWEQEGKKAYVVSRWLSEPMSLSSDLFKSPWNFLTHGWQLVTYGFAHAPLGGRAQFAHIGMNMFVLWMFGREVESKYGKWEFLRFYLAGIVASGLVWAVIHYFLAKGGLIYGASGAVTAVVILFVLNFPTRTLYLFGLVAVPAWTVGILYIALDIFGSMTRWDNVAYEAHLAGAAFALVYHRSGLNFGRFWPRAWRMPDKWLKPQPQLKVHDPDPEEHYRDLDEQADHILEKLHRQGEQSLSRQERQILEDYSRRMRQKHR